MLHKRFNFMILVRIKQYALYIAYKFFILANFKICYSRSNSLIFMGISYFGQFGT